jgi:hypothetical protein
MNPEIQQLASIIGIGLGAFLIIVITGFFCFVFPKKCDKCGKLRAFKSTRVDTARVYTAGGFIVSDRYISKKICISCGFESEPKLCFEDEKVIRG